MSSSWSQLWSPTALAGQSKRLLSVPVQRTLSSHMGELVAPIGYAPLGRIVPPAAPRENKNKGSMPFDRNISKTRVN